MANRLFNIAALVSTIAFCLIVIGWAVAWRVDSRKQFVSLAASCHISIEAHGLDARLVVFNEASYGPYSGSIIGIANDPSRPKVSGVGDVAGIYYRHILWPNGASLWTFSLGLAYPLVVATILPVLWVIRRRHRRGRGFPVEG